MPTLATFNANNFFLRYRFAGTYPGDQSKKSAVEAGEVALLGYVPEKKSTDFNDTEQSPWLSPLLSSRLLVDVVARTRPADDRWTYYWRARGRVQQIDFVLASKALAARVTKTHIERAGLGFDRLGAAGDLLPRQVTLTHFEDDGATPVPKKVTPPKKLDFQFERYEAVLENHGNCISDHCPVKVWW